MAKQLDIFLEDRSGTVASVTELLYSHGINIRAVTIQDRSDVGTMKLLVDKPEEAHRLFAEKGFECCLKDVLAILVDDQPGGLYRLAAVFSKHGINVLDGYGFVLEPGKSAVWCVQVDDLPSSLNVVTQEGFQVLEDHVLYSL